MKRNMTLISVIALFLLPLTVQAGSPTSEFVGRVVGVSDGDTIKVMHNGKEEKIRLLGIDCPEKAQPFGSKAKQFTSGLAFGKTVTVQVKDTDKYRRTIANVLLPDGRVLNRELVAAGLAWWYRTYSQDESLGLLEIEARTAKRGLWVDQHPTPPWEWRRAKKNHDVRIFNP